MLSSNGFSAATPLQIQSDGAQLFYVQRDELQQTANEGESQEGQHVQ